jgi:hypothetical protein
MIPEHINQQIKEAFTAEMEDKYHLVYTAYDESFNHSAENIQECMEKHEVEPLYEITDDWFSECQYQGGLSIIDELKNTIFNDGKYADIQPYIEDWLDDADNKDYLRFQIEERDHSDPISELIGRTRIRARITQYSNFDGLSSNWDLGNTYHYKDYFKDIIDTLWLNPATVKKVFTEKGITAEGIWVNLAYRNGKEAVEYNDFADEVKNQTCNCFLVFMGMFPLQDMYENGFAKYHQIIVPKGNSCGFYCWCGGGGSLLSMTLKRDLVLPVKIPKKSEYDRFELDVDERNCENGYCIDEVYGLIEAAWGEEFQLIYN